MRVLLDTHLFLWAVSAPAKLSVSVRKRIDAADVFVSAASIWEVSIKASTGKLMADATIVLAAVDEAGFTILPI